ncbi:MAG: ribonuclease Y [Phycisphaerae bacterium]
MGLVMLSQVSTLTLVYPLVAGVAVGAGVCYFALKLVGRRNVLVATEQAQRIIDDAAVKAGDRIKAAEVEAKARFLKEQGEFDKKTAAAKDELREIEKRLEKRDDLLNLKLETLISKEKAVEAGEAKLRDRAKSLDADKARIDELVKEQKTQLLRISSLTPEQARQSLFKQLEQELAAESAQMIDAAVSRAQDEAAHKSREIIITALQRYAADHTADSTVSTVDIPNDEMKGRVIGREGRNIRAFERATGVDVIVDDTPGVVVVSGFDPVRREVARRALGKLIQDGRIHPTRIEDLVTETRGEVEREIIDIGKKAALEANVPSLNRKLIDLLGRLQFRTSYGQNVLRHSIEVAYMCQIMADEIGLDGAMARRCGLLHDIGKAVDHEVEGGHPAIGAEICRKFNEPEEVLNAVAGHHGDVPATSPYTPLVAAADAMSASRPGGRRESLERYIKRMEQLETIATNHPGVTQAFAIQAGREVRVIVDARTVDDAGAMRIARDIAKQIESDMTYPGEVKVTLLREVRAVEYAR